MHHSTTLRCSSCDRVGLSPVVPTGTSPLVPSEICQSTRSRNAFSSTPPFLNGVTRAVNDPRKVVLAGMALSGKLLDGHEYRVGGADESPTAPAPGHHRSRPCFAYVPLLALS